MGDRFISWKYIKEVGWEVPKDIYDSSWNKIVNTGYQCAQSSYIIQTELGNKNIDLLSCKAADLTEEDLLAKNKNYIPPGNYNISEWVKVVNSGFRLGQYFFLNDMRNQQETNNAQIALSLSSGEQEGMVSADQEFEQVDKEINATPQMRSTPRKKATPQKKNTIKPAALKQQVSNLTMKQEVLNSDVKDFLKTELISTVQNAMESLVNIVKAVITKDFCRAADLLARKEGQAALEKLNMFGNILLCDHSEISLMKKPKEQQQSTSSTFVVAPTDEVAHSSFHSAHPIMDKTPIWRNSKQDYSDMIVDSVRPEKNFLDQQVYDGTKAIKREISENQPVNGQPKNDPFTDILNSDEFTAAFGSPKKGVLNEPQKANKYMKFSAFSSPEDSTQQLIQLAPSKATRINMATAFLMSKKQWRPQNIWSAVSELNRVIARPESGNMFYQIIARYFEKFRDIALVEVGNVIRVEIVNYLLVHQNWIQVRKFEVRNASKLYIVFLFFFCCFFAKYLLFSQH